MSGLLQLAQKESPYAGMTYLSYIGPRAGNQPELAIAVPARPAWNLIPQVGCRSLHVKQGHVSAMGTYAGLHHAGQQIRP